MIMFESMHQLLLILTSANIYMFVRMNAFALLILYENWRLSWWPCHSKSLQAFNDFLQQPKQIPVGSPDVAVIVSWSHFAMSSHFVRINSIIVKLQCDNDMSTKAELSNTTYAITTQVLCRNIDIKMKTVNGMWHQRRRQKIIKDTIEESMHRCFCAKRSHRFLSFMWDIKSILYT